MKRKKEDRPWVLYSINNPTTQVYVYFNEWGELKWDTKEPSTFEDLDIWLNGKIME